ncbi:MAG TPA: hypothetical protein PLJ47_10265 [Candidatus Hydrogenedentes bacterium]|nr:hypothetical protein [Candidatus Hydrogenedentota bacterium]HRK34966.1 hypothetical protein [Candidatus Hydrogenedentota bacterium]
MNGHAKRVGVFALVVFVFYFVILPLLLPGPVVAVTLPAEAGMRDRIPITVSVRAWHRNIDISRVRFYVDYTATTAKGPKGTFYPELLLDTPGKRYVGAYGSNPLVLPYRQVKEVELLLARFAEEGLLGPGELIGKVDITYNFKPNTGGKSATRDRTRTATQSVPFKILIRE